VVEEVQVLPHAANVAARRQSRPVPLSRIR
jgi:hypothetical protein